MRIYDISQEVFSCEVFEGDPEPKKEQLSDMKSGALYNLTALSMCAHNGTHVDAPYHFFEEGKTIDQIPLDHFVGFCYLARTSDKIDAREAEEIMRKAIAANAGERIVLAGDLTVTAPAARVFAEYKIKLIGNESQTVGPIDAPMEVHKILLGNDIVLLEGIRLDGIEEGRYFLNAAPLNLSSSDGSPCRAILIGE